MRVKANVLGVLVLVAIFGGIMATSVFNVWNTSSTKVPVRYQSGEFQGEYDPSDIRGSYTFGDIYNAYDVPVDILGKAFGVENNQGLADFQVKNLEAMYTVLKEQGKEVGTGSVRLFVGLYKGLPIELSEENFLPKPAVDILIEKGHLSEEQLVFIKTHVADITNIPQKQISSDSDKAVDKPTSEKVVDEHSEEERVVKGKTTFYEVLSWGVSEEQLEEIIGGKIPTPGMTVSDYCGSNGIPFSEVKDTLNSLIEK